MLDTDVLVAATRSRSGASWQPVDRGEVALLLSIPLVLEYETVLIREEDSRGSLRPEMDK